MQSLIRRAIKQRRTPSSRRLKHSSKNLIGYFNSRKPIRHSIGPPTSDQGVLISSNAEIAEVLNHDFARVFTEENQDAIPVHSIRYCVIPPLEGIEYTAAASVTQIKTLKVNKSAGSDGFFPKVIKTISEKIALHLMVVFNQSMDEGQFPTS